MLRDMFKKTYIGLDKNKTESHSDTDLKISGPPAGMWRKCKKCNALIYAEDVRANFYICPKCLAYFRVHAYRRIEMICDKSSFEEWNQQMPISNPLNFPGYEEKIQEAKEKSKLDEAVVTGKGKIEDIEVAIAVCDARFMMSSMGKNVGEKLCYMIERAISERLPVIIYSCSGGARMQEGIVSLMQMAKTSAALKRLSDEGLLFISVLTDPTMGGVTASFAMLGDVILAEPKALIGFAGPRVIAQTIGAKLPEGFQRAEFLLEHGFVDKIVERKDQKRLIADILRVYSKKELSFNDLDKELDKKVLELSVRHKRSTAWESVLLSRKSDRPTAKDYIDKLFTDFIEFHGDRYFADDKAIVGGIALFHGRPITVITQQKGKNLKENKLRNFAMPSPEGYRKALRLMKLSEKFDIPVLCLVDTPGAFCGIEAEERGQGEAIARNLYELSGLRTPILSIVIGEGGSGGALAMAVSDEVWIMENAIYSILSPEGFASILYKDAKLCKEAAEDMKITSAELKNLGIVERVIPEPHPATAENMEDIIKYIDSALIEFLADKYKLSKEMLLSKRYERYRKY